MTTQSHPMLTRLATTLILALAIMWPINRAMLIYSATELVKAGIIKPKAKK